MQNWLTNIYKVPQKTALSMRRPFMEWRFMPARRYRLIDNEVCIG